MGIRKIQYAPNKQGNQPCTVVRKDFLLSPGELELEMTLDKQVISIISFKYDKNQICETVNNLYFKKVHSENLIF